MSKMTKDIEELRQIRDSKIGPHHDDDFIESYDTKDGGRIDIFHDYNAENPFIWEDTVGIIAEDLESDDQYEYAMGQGAILAIPLFKQYGGDRYKLDRNTEPENTAQKTIYATAETIYKKYREGGATMKQIIECFEEEVDQYNKWIHGEMLGITMWDKDGNHDGTHCGYSSKEDIKLQWE